MRLRRKQQTQRQILPREFSVSSACSVAEITELKDHWLQLESKNKNKLALFQSFDWVLQWCQAWDAPTAQAKAECRPYIVTIWQHDQLVCIWALQRGSKAGVNSLSWLSSPALQYGDVLIDADCDTGAVFAAAWEYIESTPGIDLLQFDNVAETSPIHAFLSQHCGTASNSKSSILEISAFSSWTEYQASVKNTTRRARRKRFNKLARAGDLVFAVHQSPEKFETLVDVAVDWKRLWLNQQHWPNALMSAPSFKAFLQKLGGSTNDNSASPKWVAGELSLDGNPVAVEIGAIYANRYFSFLGAFDIEFGKFSPGKIEMEAMISWAIDLGLSDFDFLSVPSQYKSDWTDTSIALSNFTYAVSVRGKVYHSVWLKRLRPAVKHGFHQIPASQRKMLSGVFKKQFGISVEDKF